MCGDVPALGQQVLAELVQDDELAREDLGRLEALCHEHDLADEGEVGHNHGHGSEQRLKGDEGGGVDSVDGRRLRRCMLGDIMQEGGSRG